MAAFNLGGSDGTFVTKLEVLKKSDVLYKFKAASFRRMFGIPIINVVVIEMATKMVKMPTMMASLFL